MSTTFDLSAPAPASVGMSYKGAGRPRSSCPCAIHARMSSLSSMPVAFIPSGSRIRCRTSASYEEALAALTKAWPSKPTPRFEYSNAEPMSRSSSCPDRNSYNWSTV